MKIKILAISFGIIIIIIILVLLFNQRSWYTTNLLPNLTDKYNFLLDNYIKNELSFNINIPIYYINLNKSINRRKSIEKQQDLYNLKVIRVPAIYGKDINYQSDIINLSDTYKIKFQNYDNKSKIIDEDYYVLSCTLSHIKAIWNAYSNGDNLAIIIEDDASFILSSYNKKIEDIINDAPANWDIISLFNMFCKMDNKNAYIKHDQKLKYCEGAVAYVINRKGMRTLLSNVIKNGIIQIIPIELSKNNILIASDHVIYNNVNNMWYWNGLPPIIPFNNKVVGASTIHESHNKHHKKRVSNIIDQTIKENNILLRPPYTTSV